MGVTLERVQNKFACIIGELSHDPDILSQFAIWVDLRIAEYKAKGAISLECTGDDPNPTWLRGHKKSFLKGKLPRMAVRCQTEPLNHPETFNEQFTQEAEERLSPNIVVVKNEPGTDIFPVNVHANSSTVNAVSSSRKRPSSCSYSPEDLDHTSQLPLKLGKHSSSPAVLEPMNQSLMSIISKCESLDESGEMSDSTANPAQDSASVAGMGDNSMCMPSASTGSTENPDNSSPDVPGKPGNDLDPDLCHLYPRVYPFRLQNSSIRTRVVSRGRPKAPHTAMDMVKSVGMFERWAWSKHRDDRQVEYIPPTELDVYLAEFFLVLRRESGEDYIQNSFRKHHYCIWRYLRESSYPVTNHKLFTKSHAVFQRRLKELGETSNKTK